MSTMDTDSDNILTARAEQMAEAIRKIKCSHCNSDAVIAELDPDVVDVIPRYRIRCLKCNKTTPVPLPPGPNIEWIFGQKTGDPENA